MTARIYTFPRSVRARAALRRDATRPRSLWFRRHWIPLAAVAALAVVAGWSLMAVKPRTVGEGARHLLAAPNCDAARAVGLAPARRGQPGYYASHDADDDGIACEPWPH